jgi:bilirubin oxidase
MMQNSVTGPFQFDGESFDMDVINQTVQLGDTEIWEIFNMSMVAHPFHIHDVQFYILDRNGIIPPENEQGRKDVVLIKQMETVRFIAKFEDHADDEVPYMYHCHMLQHEDEGLMGQFIVVGESIGIDANVTLPIDFSLFPVYPNPFNPTTTIRFHLVGMQHTASLRIYDISGQLVETLVNEKLNAGEHEIKWNAVNQSSGVYFIRLQSGGFFETEKIVLMK